MRILVQNTSTPLPPSSCVQEEGGFHCPKNSGFASWQVLIVLAILAGILLFFQRRAVNRDIEIATGPPTQEQKNFFTKAAERPDLDLFFKALPSEKRLRMAANLGEHATAETAKATVRLLSSFDPKAREILTASLVKIATKDPNLVAAELGRPGSFERLGVFRALRESGEPGLTAAARSLSDPSRRANAILFLVETGDSAIPIVLPFLNDENGGTRAAAAETLGKLRAKTAVDPILDKLKSAEAEEMGAYIIALADIGDPRTENALQEAIPAQPDPSHTRLLAGLGRIASPSSLKRLLQIHSTGDRAAREASVEAFVLGGERSLRFLTSPKLRLEVAGKIRSALADQAIGQQIDNSNYQELALAAASGRESLASLVWPGALSVQDPSVPLRIEILATTSKGRRILKELANHPEFSGYAQRALALTED